MSTRTLSIVVFVLTTSGAFMLAAEHDAEPKARAQFEAAGKAVAEAEAALVPLRAAMQKADADYASAKKAADTKRQQATDAKNLAGEAGVNELKQAEANIPVAAKAHDDAITAKPIAEKALEDARAAATPLQQAFEAAEKAAKEAEAQAKVALEVANKLDDDARKATAQATTKRRTADAAKAMLAKARVGEQNAQTQLAALPKKLADAEAQSKAAEEVLAKAKEQVASAMAVYQPAEQAAVAAEVNAKVVTAAETQQAGTDAAAKRKAADAANAALTQAQQNEQQAQARVNVLAGAPVQKKAADEALAKAKSQAATAASASQKAEQEAQTAEAAAKAMASNPSKSPAEKKKSADDAAAKRQAAQAASKVLAQAQQNEKQAEAQVAAAAKVMADLPEQKKSADAWLAGARKQSAAASTAYQTAERTAKDAEANAAVMAQRAGRTREQLQQAVADAAATRKAADAAKSPLLQAQSALQTAYNQASAAAAKLTRFKAQKDAAGAALANFKSLIATGPAACESAEQIAQAAEKLAQEKNQVAARAAAKRKAIADAAAALAQAQQNEQQAQAQVTTAAQKLAELQPQKKKADDALAKAKAQTASAATSLATAEKASQEAVAKAKQIAADPKKPDAEKKQAATDAAAKAKAVDAAKVALAAAQQGEKAAQAPLAALAPKFADAEPKKQAADAALASARKQIPIAAAAHQAARDAAPDLVQLDDAYKQAAAEAAAKRKAARDARAALAPVQQKLEQAIIQANTAAQTLTRSEARKKAAEEALVALKQRIASAKQTCAADEEAAKAAESAAAPLKAQADQSRAAYANATKALDDQRAFLEKAKTQLYRLIAGKQVAAIMESPEPPKPANRIDEIVFAKLAALGVKPVLCSDAVFIRRAYLDLTGKLPAPEEARMYILSTEKDKHAKLIDHLLSQSAHIDYWAMKWSDILKVKAEFPVKIWPNAAQAYHRWIWESIARNKRYDQFARELLTSSGSNFRVGPVNFYRAIQDKTPDGIASAVGLALMATRTHAWPEERRAGMAAFFSQVGYKPTSEWKEEIVFWDPLHVAAIPDSTATGEDTIAKAVAATNKIPQALEKPLAENGPLVAVFPDGTKITIPPSRDPREAFADWLIRAENPWFAKAITNRTWAWIMGRGIIHEPDNLRDDNPPSNPELLAYLQKELIDSGYNLKHLQRLILTSTTYQLSSVPRYTKAEAVANFAGYRMRRVEAEVLIDAVNGITGGFDLYTSAVPEPFTYIPKGMSAVELADGSVTSSFLTLFGRSARATGMESERVNELASTQWLHMLNSTAIQSKLQSGPKLAAVLAAGGKPSEIAERLYLTVLSRFPTEADLKVAEEYANSGKGREAWIDLAWALMNSPEFLMRH